VRSRNGFPLWRVQMGHVFGSDPQEKKIPQWFGDRVKDLFDKVTREAWIGTWYWVGDYVKRDIVWKPPRGSLGQVLLCRQDCCSLATRLTVE